MFKITCFLLCLNFVALAGTTSTEWGDSSAVNADSSAALKKLFSSKKHKRDTFAVTEMKDSSFVVKKEKRQPSPRIAGLWSAVIPGAGQIYNRNWWKPLIVVGGAGYIVYNIIEFNKSKNFFHEVLILKDADSSSAHVIDFIDNYPDLEKYTSLDGTDLDAVSIDRVQTQYDSRRAILQNLYIFGVVWYGLNILDAVVDAHLKNFDVSDDLSMKVKPSLLNMNNSLNGLGPALSLKFTVK